MPLTSGTRLGPYEVLGAIGAGGMGEVYKARDTRLDRIVALKVLPSTLAGDPEFRARFEREAKSISALNHPNICTLYDVGRLRPETVGERGDELDFLVMEHLEGETLAERLTKGALPSDQALEYAMQIADALDKAHRQGIVHRDLKPANVFVVRSGSASGHGVCKLLDFGLAKMGAAVAPGTIETRLVTHAKEKTTPLTTQGSILGTFQYMAPEQIEGHDADARTDIWGFGCVLYEMLTGRRAFEGKSQASLIASILERQPTPITELQPLTPPALGRVVRTCLEKHPDNRFHTAHDLSLHLRWIEEGGSAAGLPAPVLASRKRRERTMWIGVAAAALVAGAAAAWWLKPAPVVANVSERFSVPLPDGQAFTRTGRRYVAISPDGRRLAYIADKQIHLREMHQLTSQPINGTAEDPLELVFSPDGQWIAYFAPAAGGVSVSNTISFTLKKIQIAGGSPVPLCQTGWPYGISWQRDTIVFGQNTDDFHGVMSVPDTAGTAVPLVTIGKEEQATQPQLVDEGRLVLFTVRPSSAPGWDSAKVVVQAPGDSARSVLVQSGADGRVVDGDRLIYYRSGTIFGVAFDVRARAARGGSVPLVEGVQATTTGSGAGVLAVADSGTLVFVPGTGAPSDGDPRQLVWVDRQGKEEPIPAPQRPWRYPRLSPDATRIVVGEASSSSSWLSTWELGRQVLTRLTPAGDQVGFPLWMPDNRHVIYRSSDTGGSAKIMRVDASGAGAPETLLDLGKIESNTGLPDSVSPDGKRLALRLLGPGQQSDIMILMLDGAERKLQPLLAGPANEGVGVFSPDGKWLAYTLTDSASVHVFFRPYPDVAADRWQLSSRLAGDPVWARSGREIFFTSLTNRMLAVTLQPGPVLGRETELFDAGPYIPVQFSGTDYDTAPDGRFLMVRRIGVDTANAKPMLTVVTHWIDEVRSRVK